MAPSPGARQPTEPPEFSRAAQQHTDREADGGPAQQVQDEPSDSEAFSAPPSTAPPHQGSDPTPNGAASMTTDAAHPVDIRRRSVGRWIAVWFRAVVIPASRRADAALMGCAIVGGLIFGPTAMHPSDLTGLALHDLRVGAILAATWLLIFLPTARLLVRPPTAYLRSLPGAPRTALVLSGLALLILQLPWAALWIIGEGALGAAVVLATTFVVAGLAGLPPPRLRPTFPAWRRPFTALFAVHRRALRRRAGDALLRGAGLAILAGLAAGLWVRNNQLTGAPAAVLAASVIAVVVMPAQIGTALVTLGAHRETAWLAAATGISRTTRILSLASAVATIHLLAAAIASLAAMALSGPNPWLPLLTLATSLGTSLIAARTLLSAESSLTAPVRVVTGAVVAAALAIVCLATLDAAGAVAIIAVGAGLLARST